MSGVPHTRVFLVRHGATVLSAEDRFAGSTDAPLSDEGRAQAARLAHRLAAVRIAAVHASPLARTMETARILAAPHACEVRPAPELREIAHGRWEGLTRAEVEQRYPDEIAAWERDPFTFAPEGGESGLAVTARALPELLRIVAAHRGRKVVVVSHKATIRLLLSSLLGFDPRRYRDVLDQSPAALNIVDLADSGQARLTLFNDISHYVDSGLEMPPEPGRRLSSWWDPHRD